MRRLRLGEVLAAAAGVLLLVTLFLDWYSADGGTARQVIVKESAWSAMPLASVLLALAAVSGVAVAVMTATRRTPGAPVFAGVSAAVLGVLATLLTLYRHVNEPGLEGGLPNRVIEIEAPAYMAMIAAVGVLAGAWLALRDERPRGGEPEVPVDERPVPPQPTAAV